MSLYNITNMVFLLTDKSKTEFIITPNNYYLNIHRFRGPFPILIEILKHHPLIHTLTATVSVPQILLKQLWNTINVVQTPNQPDKLQCTIQNDTQAFDISITLKTFRKMLRLPSADSFPGKTSFDPIPDIEIICKDIQSLGYDGPMFTPATFNRKHLTRLWCNLYTIFNRCMTPKTSGIDNGATPIFQIFHGVVFHRHYDVASILYEEIKSLIAERNLQARKYIPFTRFFSMIIRYTLDRRQEFQIPFDQEVKMQPLQTIQDKTGSPTAVAMRIPESLLALVPSDNRILSEYREQFPAPMVQSQPIGPNPGASIQPSEGPSQPKVRKLKRKHKERSESRGDPEPVPIQIELPEQPQEQNIQTSEQVAVSTALPVQRRTKKMARRTKIRCDSPVTEPETELEMTSNVPEQTEIHQSSSQAHQDVQMEEMPSSDPVVKSPTQSEIPHTAGNDETSDYFDFGDYGEQVGFEGDLVENEIVSERSGSEIGTKENVVPSQTSIESRVTTSATEMHMLHQGIEIDVSCPLTQAQNPPSHSVSSQQETVSSCHGDLTHTLSVPRLEATDIEKRGTPPQPRPSICPLESRTPTRVTLSPSLSGSAPLSEVAGTPIETALVVASRGFGGNPVSANIEPTLSTGPTVSFCDSLVVSTGTLSEPGVSITQTFSVTPEVTDHINRLVSEGVRRTMESAKGKATLSTAIVPTVHIPSPQFQSQPHFFSTQQSSSSSQQIPEHGLSITDLKNLLHGQLLSLSTCTTLSQKDQLLLQILQTPDTDPLPATQLDVSKIMSRLDVMEERLLAKQSSCKPSDLSSSRRHDDPDSEDPHEGENQGTTPVAAQISSEKQSSEAQGSRFQGRSSESGPNEEEDFGFEEFLYDSDDEPIPLNVIEPVYMIGYELLEPTVEKPEVNSDPMYHQQFSQATNNEMQDYLDKNKENFVINIDSEDDNDDKWENIVIKEEPVDTQETSSFSGFENFPEYDPFPIKEEFDETVSDPMPSASKSSTQTSSIPVPFPSTEIPGLGETSKEGLNFVNLEDIHSPTEEAVNQMNENLLIPSELKKKRSKLYENFFINKDERLNLNQQQLKMTLRCPWLEEKAYKIFNEKESEPDKYNLIAKSTFSTPELQKEYMCLMERMLQPAEKVRSNYTIKCFVDIWCVKLSRILVPHFKVYRTDDKLYTFSEADFHNLSLDDIEMIYNHLTNCILLRPQPYIIATTVIKRYLKLSLEYAAFQDFQLGIEAGKKKINIRPPNHLLPGVDLKKYSVCTVLTKPEKGFVFKTKAQQMIFIRQNELHKYSDGTLALAYECFYKLKKMPDVDQDQLPLIKEFSKKINQKMIQRQQIRQLERLKDFRKNPFFKGTQFVPIRKGKERKKNESSQRGRGIQRGRGRGRN